MRITLEPTTPVGTADYPSRIVIETTYDYLGIEQIIDKLIRPALTAWGFGSDTLDEVLNTSND